MCEAAYEFAMCSWNFDNSVRATYQKTKKAIKFFY